MDYGGTVSAVRHGTGFRFLAALHRAVRIRWISDTDGVCEWAAWKKVLVMYVPDALDMWAAHDAKQEEEARKLPVCDYCGERVTEDHYYDFGDEVICQACLEAYFRKEVADYVS